MNLIRHSDAIKQNVHFAVDAWDCDPETGLYLPGQTKPRRINEGFGNMLMYGGASAYWEMLIGNGVGTAGQALTYFNNANAALGVGDSAAAAAATQTNLQGAAAPANRIRKGMNATYPVHADGTAVGNASITFQSTFASGEANFTWNEWALFNSATDGTGRMLNRRVVNLVTKTSAVALDLTVTVSLA